MAGRIPSAAYELYGFIPKYTNGKYSAICMVCNRELQNTASVRMQKHRNSCSTDRVRLEIKRRLKEKSETVQQSESVNAICKTEQSNLEFEDANLNDNGNDNDNTSTTYKDTVEISNKSKRARKTSIHDELKNTSTVLPKLKKTCKTSCQRENPIQSPINTHQQHHPELFETYQATTNTNNSALYIDDDDIDIDEVKDEDLINLENELDVIQNLMPRSKQSKQLQDELAKAETEYYRCKAAYFTKLTENCKIKRTLMLLESRKLQLEIERLTNES